METVEMGKLPLTFEDTEPEADEISGIEIETIKDDDKGDKKIKMVKEHH